MVSNHLVISQAAAGLPLGARPRPMRNRVSRSTGLPSGWPKRAGTAPSSVVHSRMWSYHAKSPTGTNATPASAWRCQWAARKARPVSCSASAVWRPAQ
ncbi:Uncharacterised protein [Bordetella pertussis]|nr:Uncharacterised protein [Bordetella pertussis]